MAYQHIVELRSSTLLRFSTETVEINSQVLEWLIEQGIEYQAEDVLGFTYEEAMRSNKISCHLFYFGSPTDTSSQLEIKAFGYKQLRFKDVSDAAMFKIRWL